MILIVFILFFKLYLNIENLQLYMAKKSRLESGNI